MKTKLTETQLSDNGNKWMISRVKHQM